MGYIFWNNCCWYTVKVCWLLLEFIVDFKSTSWYNSCILSKELEWKDKF